MQFSGIRIDLHVHSMFSKRPSQWVLQKLGCPESFTSPTALYSIAMARGMSMVTITDHNTIKGGLEIAHLSNVFVSEEITTYFPENNCKVHLLALDISESQHLEISKLRENIYELVEYLNQESIVHILAHPFYDMNNRLTSELFEKMLLLFKNIEMNGARDGEQKRMLKQIINNLTPEQINELANKHNLRPIGKVPWKKNITAGSDDHSSLNIARVYSYVPEARNKEEFFAGLARGECLIQGVESNPKTLGHNLYAIAYQYYKNRFGLGQLVKYDSLLEYIHQMLTIEDDEVSKSKKSSLNLKNLFSSTSGIDPLSDIIRKEAKSIVHSRFKKKSSKDKIKHKPWKLEEEWFDFVNEASERVIKNFVNSTLESFLNAKLFNVFQCIGSAGSVYTLLAPYFFSFGLFKKDRAFARECLSNLLGKKYDLKKVNTKVALFTDTFQETNGVALTLRMQLKLAKKHYKDMEIITCNSKPGPEGTAVFNPLGTFDLPEYQGLKLYYPSFLSMLEYCYNRGFNLICSSTPGPVGLCALGIAKVLNIPIHGTYHTAFPKYASELTGDFDMEELTWKYMLWYYSHMDIVYSPSKATAKELASRGLDKHKIKVYPRGIDIERFSPIKRNGFWTKYSGIKSESTKLLYVGRVSKEKNLDVLCKAYKELIKVRPDVQLIVVGQGPYLSEMQERLKATKALFTGWLYEEDLAQAYASSDVFVFPSATDTFGNVILEAQASGLPVIATDQGGPKENLIVDQTGLLVPANDSMAFYSAILHLISNPDLIEEMKLKARDYMEKRSIEAAFLKSWDMYEKNRFENPVY